MKIGEAIPSFVLQNQDGEKFDSKTVVGQKNLVIYFYPKDETPGCTKEACAFRDQYEDFLAAGAQVIGISADSVDSHRDFATHRKLPFTLLSDPDNSVRKKFGVGKSFLGLMPGRVTYVVDRKGIVRNIFDSQINIKGHIQEALDVLRSLSGAK